MLTKKFLNFRKSGLYLKPAFIATDSPVWLGVAEELLSLYQRGSSEGYSRQQIEELQSALVQSYSLKIGGGLALVCQKLAEWSGSSEIEYPQIRRELFLNSAKLLQSGESLTLAEFQKRLPIEVTDIYGDLPSNERMIGFPTHISPKNLLNRYNIGLVQGLLLHAGEIEITIKNPPAEELRRLFKYLKFCRLLAEIRVNSKKQLKIVVSGPLNLFSDSRKYGLQLATFFPAITNMPEWKISTELKLEHGRGGKLSLDQKSGLVSHYRSYSAYIPEEIRLFYRHFKEKSTQFTLEESGSFITLSGGEVIFPDLTFKSVATGNIYQLELFHRYHKHQLLRRLEQLKNGELDDNILIGVDRSITKNSPELEVENINQKLIMFSNFPGVSRINRILNLLDSKSLD